MIPEGIPVHVFYADQLFRTRIKDTPEQQASLRTRNIGLVLRMEGLANDVQFYINRARKNAGLNVSDLITLRINCGEELGWAILDHHSRIVRNTKTARLIFNEEPGARVYEKFDCGEKDMPFPLELNVEIHNENP